MTSNAQEAGAIPVLTLGWRLQMALRYGGVSRADIADYLGVSPSTISRWNGDAGEPPKRAFLAQIALRTGVSPDWLETGEGTPTPGTDPTGIEGDSSSMAAGEALSRLTQSKLARSRHAGAASTQEYAPVAA